MESGEPQADTPIYMPSEAGTATAPDGHKLVFFNVPQLELLIKQVLSERPASYTYRWAFHPGHKVHVLLTTWPNGASAGVAIPEGAGDTVLQYMVGKTHVFLTTEPIRDQLQGAVDQAVLQKIVLGNTVYLPDVEFQMQA